MHRSSFAKMCAFRDGYLTGAAHERLRILDVGSAAPTADNPGYRPLFTRPGWEYVGLDVEPGRNVDVVVASAYDWTAIADAAFDVVISGQAFEHIAWPWLTMIEIARVLRPGGLAAITAPSAGPVHRFPLDCWRYYPDGFPALAAYAGLVVEEQHFDTGYAYPENAFWGDVFAVLRRPQRGEDDERAWTARRCAARHSAPPLEPAAVPGAPPAGGVISRHEAAVLAELSGRRVRRQLTRELLRQLYHVWRLPLGGLRRIDGAGY